MTRGETNSGGKRAAVKRALKWILAIIGTILVLTIITLLTALYTDFGRDQISNFAIGEVNDLVPGTVNIKEIQRVDPSGVTLTGVSVLDPEGTEVLTLGKLEINLTASKLAKGEFEIPSVVLDGASIDLSEVGSKTKGLLAALVPDVEGTKETSGDLPSIDVEKITLKNISIKAVVPELGLVFVRNLNVDASLRTGPGIEAHLNQLSGEIVKADGSRPLAEFGPVKASYFDDGRPSELEFRGKAAGSSITISAKAVAPPHEKWNVEPIEAKVELRNVGEELLRALGQNDAAEKLRGPVEIDLNVDGVVDELRADLFVSSRGGKVKSSIELSSLEDVSLALSSKELNPSLVWTGTPNSIVGFETKSKFKFGDIAKGMPFSFDLTSGEMDGTKLPRVDAEGLLKKDRVENFKVKARGFGGHLNASGDMSFAGKGSVKVDLSLPDLSALPLALGFKQIENESAGHLLCDFNAKINAKRVNAKGKISAVNLNHSALSLEELKGEFSAVGLLPFPRVTLDGNVKNAKLSKLTIFDSTLLVDGGPGEYKVALKAKTNQGPVEVVAMIARAKNSIVVDASGKGKFAKAPWSLQVNNAQVGFGGSVVLPNAQLVALDQRVRFSGSISKKKEIELELIAQEVDLLSVVETLDLEPKLSGKLSLELHVGGTTKNPAGTLKMSSNLEVPDSDVVLNVDSLVQYDKGDARVEVEVDDSLGKWVSLNASCNTPVKSLDEFLKKAHRLGNLGQWKADVAIASRQVGTIPFVPEIPEQLRDTTAGLTAHLVHEPEMEPSGYVLFEAETKARSDETVCGGRAVKLGGRVDLLDGKVAVTLAGLMGSKKLLDLNAGAELSLGDVLDSGQTPKISGAQYDLEVSGLGIRNIPVACEIARGDIYLSSLGKGLLGKQPIVTAQLSAEGLSLGGRDAIDIEARVDVTRVEASVTGNIGHGDTSSSIAALLPVIFGLGKFELEKDKPMEIDVQLDGLPIAPLVPRTASVSRVKGHLSGKVHAAGTIEKTKFDGNIVIEGGALTANQLAQPLKAIAGKLLFTNDYIGIENLVARDLEGKLQLDGRLEMEEGVPEKVHMEISLDKFPLRQQGQVAADVNLKAVVDADLNGDDTEAKLVLSGVDVWLRDGQKRGTISLKSHPDIVDPRVAEMAVDAKDKKEKGRIHLVMDASDAFWIKRDDFSIKLATQLNIDISQDGVLVKGPVQIDRGYLYMLGENFELARKSRIEFVESNPPDPVLDLSAKVVARKTGKTIQVKIEGRASKPKLTFFVEDAEATAGDAALAIFGGEQGREDEQDATSQAKSFVAGVMASLMAVAARKELGAAAPIIMIESGDEVSSSKVRAGFEVDAIIPDFMKSVVRGIYVEGIVGGAEDGSGTQGGVLLELYFPYGLVGSGQYGPGVTWSIDATWEP